MSSVQSQPQSRGRNKVRIPLDHPETDAIAKRICILLCMDVINDDERGHLIKKYSDLRKADYRLARLLFGQPLPTTTLRPDFYDDYCRPLAFMGKVATDRLGREYPFGSTSWKIEVMSGWVHRLREYVERLERKYFDAANDDI